MIVQTTPPFQTTPPPNPTLPPDSCTCNNPYCTCTNFSCTYPTTSPTPVPTSIVSSPPPNKTMTYILWYFVFHAIATMISLFISHSCNGEITSWSILCSIICPWLYILFLMGKNMASKCEARNMYSERVKDFRNKITSDDLEVRRS